MTGLIFSAKELEGEDFQSTFSEADLAVMLQEANYQAMLAELREDTDEDES